MTLGSSINVNNQIELKDALKNIENKKIDSYGAMKYGSFHTNLGKRVRNLNLDDNKLYKYNDKYFNYYSVFKVKLKKYLYGKKLINRIKLKTILIKLLRNGKKNQIV